MSKYELETLKEQYNKKESKGYTYLDTDKYEIRIGQYGEADYYTVTEEELDYILN